MALIFISPLGSNFPGGVGSSKATDDSTRRSQTGLGVPVGTKAYDLAGNEYTAVKAGAAIAINEAVTFNAGLSDVRKTSADEQMVLGVADTAFASGDFGWLLTQGLVTCKVIAATAINSLLSSGATGGTLKLSVAATLAGARGAVQVTAEAAGLASVYLR